MLKRTLPAILLTLAVSLFLLAASVYVLGTNDDLMLCLMQRYAPPEATGLHAGEYPGVVRMITAYLRGDADEFQHRYTVDGAKYLAFNEKEQMHMADVQRLFGLAGYVTSWGRALVIAGIGVVLMLLVLLRNQGPQCLRWLFGEQLCGLYRALRTGLLIVLGAVALVAVWAAVDFNSLFILFHKIAFTNDLWWLDPRTDLLIRLMPTDFFLAYAAIIGAVWATAMGLLILIFTLLTKERKV